MALYTLALAIGVQSDTI